MGRVAIFIDGGLVLLASKQRIETAAIVTGDSDFLPAISTAKNEGVSIHLFHGTGQTQPHRDLWEMADQRTIISNEILERVRR